MAEPCSHGSAHLAYRKHSVRRLVGRTIEPAAVKTGKAASIYVGIVTTAKVPTGSAIRFIEDNAACCHFDTTSDKGI